MIQVRTLDRYLGRVAYASGAGAIVLILTAMLVFALMQRQEIKRSFEDRGDSLTGLVFQLDREFLRMQQAMLLALQQPTEIDRDSLSLRSDILNSRVELVKNSPIMLEVSTAPDYTETLRSLYEFNSKLDSIVTASRLDRTTMAEMVNTMGAVETTIQRLSHLATVTTSRNMETASLRLLNQNALIITLSLCQILFLTLATSSILRRNRQREQDQTLLLQVNDQLKHNEEKLILAANVFKHASESIVVADAFGNVLEFNDYFGKESQYTHSDLLGVHLRQLLGCTDGAAHDVASVLQAVDKTGHWMGECFSQRKDGSSYPAKVSVSAVLSSEGVVKRYALFINDVTSLKKKQQELEYVAHYDVLTGLPNRSLLLDRLQKAISASARSNQFLAVAFLDLDGFKEVNDNYGHAVGDQLLVTLAVKMQEALRAGDSIARFGGDEFVVLITGLDNSKDCIPVLNRLLAATSSTLPIAEHLLHVSASIGVTIFPDDNFDADQLVRHADHAMYLAKQGGKSQFAFFDAMQEQELKTQMATAPEIRIGLERSEFVLFYQPKVNMKTGQTVGLEALIRWNHPEKGLLLPGAFLPLIVDRAVSLKVSQWVIATAIQQMDTWLGQGLRLPVSVNVDALHLQHEDFYSDLLQQTSSHPECRGMLSIEILETTALLDIDRIRRTMQQCQSIGVEFALDDFGTGYSSLTYLNDLPVQELKVDQSFVRNMTADKNRISIVEGVISLGRAFRRKVIAEGVETTQEGDLLLQLGCELGQGYGIARPMPARDVQMWVASWKPPSSWSKQLHVPREPSMLLDELIRNAPVGVAIIDVDGVFRNVNTPYCSIYGSQCDELIGSNFSLLFPPEDRANVLEMNRKFVCDGGNLESNWVPLIVDGSTLATTSVSVRVPGNKDTAYRLVYVTTSDTSG